MSIFSKAYKDWISHVTVDGWSILTIARHPNQPKPIVMGPVDAMRGALWSVFEGVEFHHALQVFLFGIIFFGLKVFR